MTVLHFSDGELDDMANAQEGHMMDSCLIAEPSSTENIYNLPSETYAWNSATQSYCGFNANPGKEVLNQVPDSQAVVRLPIETTVTYRAMIRITKLFGRTIAPITFRVIGQPRPKRVAGMADQSDGWLRWLIKAARLSCASIMSW